MAGTSGQGDPLALEGPPQPRPSQLESRVGDQDRLAQIHFKILRGHHDAVSACCFCFEDTKILSCSYDRTVKLWDVEKGVPIQVFEEEHTAPISECSLTPDNKRVITSSYDKTVKAWDMETGKMLWTVDQEGLVTSCNISCDGKYVVSGLDMENAICVTDATNATTVAYVQNHHRSTVTRCCFDPDNERVSSVSSDKTIKLWDIIAQSTTVTIDEAHTNVISDCCFTIDGNYLCTASWDKTLKIWNIKTGEFRCHGPIFLNQGHAGSVSSCVFSKDASLVVSGAYDKTIALWDAAAGYKKLALKGHGDWVTDVAISSNKKWILSSSKDATLRLWNIEKVDHVPAAIESRKTRGSKIAQCEECEKPFSLLQFDDMETVTKCVFCRLASPSRNIFPLPPTLEAEICSPSKTWWDEASWYNCESCDCSDSLCGHYAQARTKYMGSGYVNGMRYHSLLTSVVCRHVAQTQTDDMVADSFHIPATLKGVLRVRSIFFCSILALLSSFLILIVTN